MADRSRSSVDDRTRTGRLAQFLRAAVAVKTKTVLEVNKYPTVLWFANLPLDVASVRSPLFSPTWDADDVRWLVVSRVTEPDPPRVPDLCVPWLEGVDLKTLDTPPALNTGRVERSEAGEEVQVEPPDGVREQWVEYLDQKWSAWAERAALARRVRPIYQKLFAAYQEMLGRDDAYDLFIGVGLLHARNEANQTIRRHLLSFRAELAFDSKTGTLTVSPAADFDQARVEMDFLPGPKRAALQRKSEELESDIADVGPSVQSRTILGSIVSSFVHLLDADSSYVDELAPQDAGPGKVRASFAPALIMRPRSARSIDELLAQIERDASGDSPNVCVEDTPMPWRRLIEDHRVWDRTEPQENGGAHGAAPERVYFPLPSNEEQSRIVKYTSGTAGVVVQGPPGTGKSHTIANLISHHLATGKRVLVTAQSAQALRVLRDKLPKDLQTLCVSLLGATSASDKELQRSVKGILSRRQEVENSRAYEREAAKLESRLAAAEARIASLERTLRDARAAETEVVEPLVGYRGTRAGIARRLNEERAALGWIPDEVSHEAACPSYALGWERLAQYHQTLSEDVREALRRVRVQIPFDRAAAIDGAERINRLKAEIPETQATAVSPIPSGAGREALSGLLAWLEALQDLEMKVPPGDTPWFAELRGCVIRNDLNAWQALQSEAAGTLDSLSEAVVADTRKIDVSGRHTRAEARRDVRRLSEHYRSGRGRRILWLFRPRVIKETEWIEQSVQVEGTAVRARAEVERARRALEGWALVDAAWEVWSRWPVARAGSARQQVAVLRSRLATLDGSVSLGRALESMGAPLRQWLREASTARCSTSDLVGACRRRVGEVALADARAERDGLAASLNLSIGNEDAVPPARQLLEALLVEDVSGVRTAFVALAEEDERRVLHGHYEEFLRTVRSAAPRLAEAITASEGSEKWGECMRKFPLAWSHRCAATWLKTVLSNERIEAVDRAARDERGRAQDLLRDIAIAKAWHAALDRIDDRTRAAFVGWTQAVAHIPASGKSVFRRRAVARSYLRKSLEAIPAWVASLGRLYETIDARPGMFDIAIVDEASQCWLDSLVLFYLAKQIIVVGDDKQISPTVVGVSDGEIEDLARAYIPDFEHRGSFTIESSLFDHAQRYLPAGVPLQEHFRCVPEIIRFSNELCYTDRPLIPLRLCGRDRLDPLRTVYLADGMRQGDINEVEARAIVEAIVRCNEDETYDEAEFGVICLQGDDQAARIQQLLLERLGPGVFEERKLRCGNPYAFQGDERDVMFLSMVAAPNATNAPLTTRMFEQRFNVALSRARDQVWLFHSIREQELSPRCLRRRVLEFFRQPPDLAIRGSAMNIPQLQLVSARADRRSERPPAPFDSWFELDVALALAARGYTLSAQVQIAKRRIDLVIEGDGTRLGVECDGEAWHGPEQFAEDTFRQRQLERAGWRFARVRESLFYSDADRAIREVIEAFEELGVESGTSSGSGEQGVSVASRAMPTEAEKRETGVAMAGVPMVPVVGDESGGEEEAEETVQQELSQPGGFSAARDKALSGVAVTAFDDERDGPFSGYGSKDYPDPRTAPPTNIRDAVLDIVRTDGPLPKASIYGLYREGCPKVERVGKNLRQAINRALAALERARLVESRDEGEKRDPTDVVVKLPSQSWVDGRAPGKRGLDDVPLSELAWLMRTVSGLERPASDDQKGELYRAIARRFNIQRLRPQWFPRLERAWRMAFGG